MRILPASLGRSFNGLWFGTGAANLGDGMALFALPLLALAVGASPGGVAAVTTALTLAWPLFGLHAGWIADRVDRRALLTGVNLARAALLARPDRRPPRGSPLTPADHRRGRPARRRGNPRRHGADLDHPASRAPPPRAVVPTPASKPPSTSRTSSPARPSPASWPRPPSPWPPAPAPSSTSWRSRASSS
ncbi:hypothetical protein ACFSTC_56355 [Nonomuraea ferruginea]